MNTLNLNHHYKTLLGLSADWDVAEVDLSLPASQVVITLIYKPNLNVTCPNCDQVCTIADHAPQRQWRHLDTMQFETILQAKVPRSDCPQCGVLTISIPWAQKNSRFTLFFEAFAIRVLQACSDIKSAATLLKIDWTSADVIMKRAVRRGLIRRDDEEITYIGIDEKSYQKKHSYATIVNDIDNGRVLEVIKGRDSKAVEEVYEALSDPIKGSVKAIAMDMWQAYISGAKKHLPNAMIVHDKFHICKYLNDAVNKVRQQEHAQLLKQGKDTLTGNKQLFLFNPEKLTDEKYLDLKRLTEMDLKISRACAIKENFRWFWEYSYKGSALKFYKQWYYWATHSQLAPIIKAAKTINKHIENILTYFTHQITNAVAEGLNSKIQALKVAARGFRNFENYRIRILFFCGKLKMAPGGVTH